MCWAVTIYEPLFKYLFQNSNENRNSLYTHAAHIPLGEIFNIKSKETYEIIISYAMLREGNNWLTRKEYLGVVTLVICVCDGTLKTITFG